MTYNRPTVDIVSCCRPVLHTVQDITLWWQALYSLSSAVSHQILLILGNCSQRVTSCFWIWPGCNAESCSTSLVTFISTGNSCLSAQSTLCFLFPFFVSNVKDTDAGANSMVSNQSPLEWQTTDWLHIQRRGLLTRDLRWSWWCWNSSSSYLFLSLDNFFTDMSLWEKGINIIRFEAFSPLDPDQTVFTLVQSALDLCIITINTWMCLSSCRTAVSI